MNWNAWRGVWCRGLMETLLVIILATVMAVFGVLGYQRGGRSSLVTLIITGLGMLVLSLQSGRVVSLINGIGVGVRFALAGGLTAMGGGDNSDAMTKALAAARAAPKLIPADRPEIVALALLGILVFVALLLGLLKWFRRPASVLGLILGLLNGYLLSAYVLGSLFPQFAILPSPLLPKAAAQAVAARPATPASAGLEPLALLSGLVGSKELPLIATLALGLLILIATRSGARGGKKG
jgi:hypothetical protein